MSTTPRKPSAATLEKAVVEAALAWHAAPSAASRDALAKACATLVKARTATATATATATEADFGPAVAATGEPAPPAVLAPGRYTLYSDGACHGNPGPAGTGWAALQNGKVVTEGFAPLGISTNQVAEIRAAAEGLEALPEGSTVEVYTDSLYVVQTMRGAFKRKANLDHWAVLDQAVRRHAAVTFHHIRGHAGHEFNERADRLANQGAVLSRTAPKR